MRIPDRPLLESHPSRRVCIVLLSGIGDVVHGLPLANDLKRHDPSRRILWIAEPAPAAVLEHHPAVDEIIAFRKADRLNGILRLRRELRGRRCDITLNMQRYIKGVFPTLLSGAPVRVGLPPSKTRDGVSWFNTHHLPEQPWRHTQDIFLDYRKVLGLPTDGPIEYGITLDDDEQEASTRFFEKLQATPVVGVVLATANRAKDWPAERYAALVDELSDRYGYQVLLIGGPSEAEREAAELIERITRRKPISGLGNSVRRMIWMVGGVDLLVSPDTGPLHIAHAMGTPVVGLFGHTNPWRVGPYSRYHDLVIDRYTPPGSSPDPSLYEPNNSGMQEITVEDVLEKVEMARQRYGSKRGG